MKQRACYANDIIEQLSKTDMIVMEGTLYPLLNRLKKDGILKYEWQESKTGPPRKYYTLTPQGHQVLVQLDQSWTEISNTVNLLHDKLIHDGYNAESLHGDLSQQQRDLTMQKFRQHLTQLLVATDVAARGLDVDDLTHVINFGLPDDIESYTHRSGRTGRAGKKGTSISIMHIREKHKMRAIEKEIGKSFVEGVIPSAKEICKKQLYKVMDQIVKTDVNDEEIDPFMTDINRYFEFIDKEDLIKKIVSMEFGKFLAYYADAPEIEAPSKSTRDSSGKRVARSVVYIDVELADKVKIGRAHV